MKKIIQTVGVSLMLAATTANAMKLIPTQSNVYYKLGGSSVFIPAIKSTTAIKIGAHIKSHLLPNCSGFNPMVSLKHSLDNLKNQVNGLENTVVTNLTQAVYGYPLAKLQQSFPGIYDILQNQSLFAGDEFKVKVARCEQVKKQVMQGQSPLDGLISITDSQGWVEAAMKAKTEEVDINDVAKNITKNSDEYGLPWLHNRNSSNNYAGGKNQKEIKVIKDVVIAGYNLLASPDAELDSLSAPNENTHATFVRFWPNPTIASQWATKVLGDITFTKKEDASVNSNQAGIGLTAVLQSCPHITENGNTCVSNVATFIWQLVDGQEAITPDNLSKLSSSNMAITADIITTIQSLPREEQILAVSKLSEDIAIQNLLEEALSLRSILYAGFYVQEVQNLKPVRDMVKSTIVKLNTEIESLAFESNVRKQMANRTLQTILSIRDEKMANSQPDSQHSDAAVKHGAIYKQGGVQ